MNLDELPIRLRNHKEALTNAIEALTLARDHVLQQGEEQQNLVRATEFYRSIVEEIGGKGRSNTLVALKARADTAEAELKRLREENARLQADVENLTEQAQTSCDVCEGLGCFPLSESVDNSCSYCSGKGKRSYKSLLQEELREHALTDATLAAARRLLYEAAPHVETAWNHEGQDNISTLLDSINLFLKSHA